MGAWIETDGKSVYFCFAAVAPYMGAWIETQIILLFSFTFVVAPYMGAWIETCRGKRTPIPRMSRSLYGSVD